jgi:hypothetical protein
VHHRRLFWCLLFQRGNAADTRRVGLKHSNHSGVRPAAHVRVFYRYVDTLTSALHCLISPERSIGAARRLHQSIPLDE